LRHVNLTRKRLRAFLFNFCRRRFGAFGVDIGEHDARSLARETEANGAADALPCARNNRDLPCQSHDITKPPFTCKVWPII
jgi:hypothetical protein